MFTGIVLEFDYSSCNVSFLKPKDFDDHVTSITHFVEVLRRPSSGCLRMTLGIGQIAP